MNASTYVGRIGVLAGALGVGAALFAGPGIASAEPSGRGAAGPSTSDTANGPDTTDGPGTTDSPDTIAPAAGLHAGASEAADASEPAQRPRTSLRSSRVSPNTAEADSDTLEPATLGRGEAAPADSAPEPEPEAGPSPATGIPTTAATPGDASPVAPEAAGAQSVDIPEVIEASAAESPWGEERVAAPSAAELPSAASAAAAPAETLTAPTALDQTVQAVTEARPVTAEPIKPVVELKPTLPAVVANTASRISTAVTSLVTQLAQTFSWNSPFAPPAESPTNWLLAAAARRELGPAAATPAAAQTSAVSPTLFVLNGYNVVASSPQLVTSFYGPFVNFPGFPGVQSVQSFDLVDPKTDTTVGSFRALQSTFHAIGTARQFVVTEVLSGDPDKVPAIGSIINANGDALFSTVYTSVPGGKVTYDIVTPFFSIPQFTWYNAATGLTDYIEVNKPVKLEEGFFIAPTTPSTERFTAITGLPPLFAALQGAQEYSLFDKSGAPIGSFEGLVTTTSDLIGLFTKAILITDTGDATNVGTGVGQVPPVGTVYNLINFSEQFYVIYSSMPSPSGNVFATKVVTPFGSFDIPFAFDASAVPDVKLQVPGSYKFVPTSEMVPAGVNGLPPREVILQGYQQFDVVDVLGNKIGSVDANVMRQWDWFGGTSTAIMISEVRSGSSGVLPWNVPPVGSVFNFRVPYGINIGLSDFYSSVPTALGSIVTFQTVTPFGIIPLFLPNDLSKGLAGASYVNPFRRTFQV